jgi:diguanylate cyclase (GGDEF)-like protein/PAS domain S-box-containing protein
MMAVCDGTTLIHINPSGMRLLGLARPSEAVGRSFFHFVHRDYADLAELGLDGFVEEAGKISIKLAQVGGGGVDAHLWVTRLNDEGLLLVEAHDITDHLRAAQSLRNREQRLEGIINSVADGILTVNGIGTIQTFNPAAESIFGYRRDEVIGKTLQMLIPDTAAGLAVDEPGWVRVLAALPEVIGRRKNGDAMPLELAVREVQQGDTLSYTGIVRDISARKAAEQRVFRMAHYDALTDLPNRNLFGDRLEEAHKRARRHGEKLAIFFVDLNRFKPINDTYGHAVGDAVLREVSRRLKAGMRATDTIARVGGDEFMVLLEELRDIPEVEEIRQKLLQVLSQPMLLGNRQLSIGASIGFAVYPDHSEEIAELIALADKDMYRHKEASRGAL